MKESRHGKDTPQRKRCLRQVHHPGPVHRAGWDEATQIRREVSFTKGRIIVRGKRGDPYLYFVVPKGAENTAVSAACREQQLSSDSKGLGPEKELFRCSRPIMGNRKNRKSDHLRPCGEAVGLTPATHPTFGTPLKPLTTCPMSGTLFLREACLLSSQSERHHTDFSR